MMDGLIILDVDQRVLDLNPRAQEFLGWQARAKETLGLDMKTILPLWDKIMVHYEREKEFRQEIILEDPIRRHVDVRITDLYDSRNHPCGFLVVLRDITDRKLAEEEKSRLLDQTQQDALIKTELLKEINHRVKNNLMAIIGLLLNEKSQAPEAGKPFVDTAINNLTRRIEGLLQVHQMLSDTEWTPMSLTELANSIIRPVMDTAPPGCRVELVVQPSPIKVSPRQANNLALLFNELATNTVKYAFSQKKEIKIHCRADRQDGMISIEYRDNGPGYPPGVLSGWYGNIGMSLVRQLVTQTLRGDLSLSNDGGAVTTMHIRIEDTKNT
jgi:PAS domain S-box-containing protein